MFRSLSVLYIIIFLNKFSTFLCFTVPEEDLLQQSPGFRYLKFIDLRANPNSESIPSNLAGILKNEEGIDVRSGSVTNDECTFQKEIKFKEIVDELKEIAVAIKAIDTAVVELNNTVAQLKKEISEGSAAAKPRSCQEISDTGSGYHTIKPELSKKSFLVFCDMNTTYGGGWTVIQNRFDGSVNFNRSWQDYKLGFGNPHGEFWLGLDHIYELMGRQGKELYIELEEKSGEQAYAYFEEFKITSEEDGYRLIILKGYGGTAGNSLDNHIGMKFSTYDRDQDVFDAEHCAQKYGGGWWFKRCYNSHLNGIYQNNPGSTGIAWEIFGGVYHSLAKSKMMIR